jgi:uncharacterized protein YbjT (DUF2867 family)
VILLAGATGHLGQHVLKQLGIAGFPVRALVRGERQAADLYGLAQEVFRGDLCDPASLNGCCTNIDTVISTAGASLNLNAESKAGFREVDFQGNSNLLAEAKRARVRKFVYLSVLSTPELAQATYVRAKEDFAARVMVSGLDPLILRPTGFFSAYADLIPRARRGRIVLFGDGRARTNPIDDEEVAFACVAAIGSDEHDVDLGGPDILTRREIAGLAFNAVGRTPSYLRIPTPLLRIARPAIGLFNQRLGDLTQFESIASSHDAVAPACGSRRLSDYFTMLARHS